MHRRALLYKWIALAMTVLLDTGCQSDQTRYETRSRDRRPRARSRSRRRARLRLRSLIFR